jgi:SAM-dependent methyltransferase
VLARAPYVRRVLPDAKFAGLRDRYDLAVRINRTVTFDVLNADRIERLSPALSRCVHESTLRNDMYFAAYTSEAPYRDGELAKHACKQSLNRKSLLGFSGATPFSADTWVYLAPSIDALDVLRRHGLLPGRYITLHDGFDTSFAGDSIRSTKQWPLRNWNALVGRLRKELPQYSVVQLGGRHSVPFAKVHVDLVGTAGLDDVAWLLKYAACHVDNESGIVRLAREMGGRSVVIFGPTDVDFFGFDENINLRPKECGNCFWSTPTWLTDCPRGLDKPTCMSSTTVDDVFDAIVRVVDARPAGAWHVGSARLFEAKTLQRDAGLLAEIFRAAGIGQVPMTRSAASVDRAFYIDASKQWEYLFAMEQVRALQRGAHGPPRIADLGGGRGALSVYLASVGAKVTVFDTDYGWGAGSDPAIEERFFRAGRSAGVEIRYGSLFNVPAADSSFDAVTCISVLEHVPDQSFALREAWRILRPGGVLIMTFDIAEEAAPYEVGPRLRILTPERLAALFAELGIDDTGHPFALNRVNASARVVRALGVGGIPAGMTVGGLVLRKTVSARACASGAGTVPARASQAKLA